MKIAFASSEWSILHRLLEERRWIHPPEGPASALPQWRSVHSRWARSILASIASSHHGHAKLFMSGVYEKWTEHMMYIVRPTTTIRKFSSLLRQDQTETGQVLSPFLMATAILSSSWDSESTDFNAVECHDSVCTWKVVPLCLSYSAILKLSWQTSCPRPFEDELHEAANENVYNGKAGSNTGRKTR